MRRVLLLDPDVARRDRLCHGLTEEGLLAIGIGDQDGLVSIDLAGIDVVLSKVDLPSGPATRLRDRLGGLPLILFTDDPSVRRAVEAMQQGAADYLVLPFDTDRTDCRITRAWSARAPPAMNARNPPMAMIVGHCPAMLDLFERFKRSRKRAARCSFREKQGPERTRRPRGTCIRAAGVPVRSSR